MEKKEKLTQNEYLQILKDELITATGCTEPISIALAGALAKKALKRQVQCLEIAVSNNILKNVKSVVVPNTGGCKGIESALAAGIVAGDANKGLQVISSISEQSKKDIKIFLNEVPIKILPAENDEIFDIVVRAFSKKHVAMVHITAFHTNVEKITLDDEVVFFNVPCTYETGKSANGNMCVKDIIDFIENVSIEKLAPIIEKQINCNMAICSEGLKNNYGANIGKTMIKAYGNDVKIMACALAAAGSDARMSGCEMPVVVTSGSGNQGITASVPVYVFAQELKLTHEQALRAVALSVLLTIHLKTGIGRLSAYCGVVSAGCAAGAAIAYMHGGGENAVNHTIVNAVAIVSGIVCDGAKPSCAGKIVSAVQAGILGWQMYENGQQFYCGEGIVQKGVENTIKNVNRLGKEGMRQTDEEIIKIMLGN